MLKTKSILKEKEKSDGIRISVMSRHTYSDGITPDIRIKENLYEEHLQKLAPEQKLIGAYYKRGLSWNEFEKKYLEQLQTKETSDKVKKLAKRSLEEDITILCIEDSPEKCHRRILAEECKRYEPSLMIKHN